LINLTKLAYDGYMFQWVVIITTLLANLLIAYIVFRNNPKSVTNRLIAFLAITLAAWTVTNSIALSPGEESFRLFFVRLTMVVTTPFGPLIFLLASAYPNTKLEIKKHKKFYGFMIIFNTITAVLALSPYMFTDLKNLPNNSFSLTPGPAIALFGLNFMGFMSWGFVRLIKKFKKAKGVIKKQLSFFLTGLIVAFTLMTATNFLAVVVFGSIELTYLGPPFTLIMVGAMAYAIVKHRFLDIRLLIIRSLAYTLAVAFIAAIFVGITFAAENYILHQQIPLNLTLASTFTALILVFTFQYIKDALTKFTENIFYQHDYDSQTLLHGVGEVLSSTLELSKLNSQFLNLLEKSVKLTDAEIVLSGSKDENFKNHKKNYSAFKKFLDKNNEQVLIFEEINESEIKEYMRELGLSVVVSLKVSQQDIGLLLLKEKRSGDSFSNEDLRILQIIAPQLSVAIKNSLSYEEIKNFSKTLQHKVDIATEDLKEANVKLKKLDKLKNEFVSVASHELRTPMTAIKNYLWLAINESPKGLNKKIKDYLDICYGSTERLIDLVNEMLLISRIESNKIKLEHKKLDWNEIVEKSFKELKIIAKDRKIKFSLNKPKTKVAIKGDQDKLSQVIHNVVGNALKFTPESGSVTIIITKEKTRIITKIIDTGPGLSKQDRSRLFVKFGRLDHSYVQTKAAGSGLGLYVSQEIMKLHRGEIRVESQLGKGSTFILSLPLI
jgi:signal transduction histidine kinase